MLIRAMRIRPKRIKSRGGASKSYKLRDMIPPSNVMKPLSLYQLKVIRVDIPRSRWVSALSYFH